MTNNPLSSPTSWSLQQLSNARPIGMTPDSPHDVLCGVRRKDWPGLIQGWLVASDDATVASVERSQLPLMVLEHYRALGYSDADFAALAALQEPSAVAEIVTEAIFYAEMNWYSARQAAQQQTVLQQQIEAQAAAILAASIPTEPSLLDAITARLPFGKKP